MIYIVIDGMSDLPIRELGNKTPLEVANTHNMDLLAENGKTGIMYTVSKGIAPESDVAVISILGYDPFRYYTGRGPLEAFGANLTMNDGDLALRCNFATLGTGNKIVDRRGGRDLTAEEVEGLAKSINEEVELELDFIFRNTMGHRGVLIMRRGKKTLSGEITNTDPAYSRVKGLGVAEAGAEMVLKKCEPMDGTEEARVSARLVNEFVQKSYAVLDKHEINEKRVAEGRLKANVIITRDAGNRSPKFFNINKKYGVRFACLADMPVERGIAKLAGMHLVNLPPPSKSLEKDCILRTNKLLEILPFHDCFYIHIKGPDVPGHDGKYRLKTKLIATIDKHFVGNLLQRIEIEDFVVCITADHSTPCKLMAHSDDPVPVLISGDGVEGDKVDKFSEKECRNGGLGVLERGTELMPKLIRSLQG